MSRVAPGPTQVAAPPRRRFSSLDTCRGILLLVNVAMISLLAPRPYHFSHASWEGAPVLDWIFPTFVTLSGCGMAFAYRRHVRWRRTLRRGAVLLVVGLGYNAIIDGSLDPATWRFTGVLQLYAVLVLVVGALHRFVRTPRGWMGVTAVVGAAHLAFLLLWQRSCLGATLTPECNPSGVIDPAVYGAAHLYQQGAAGHDPEGLVAIVGALLTMCVGVTAGHLLLADRARVGQRREGRGSPLAGAPVRLAAWSGAVALAGLLAMPYLPLVKRIWTTPFGLLVAAGGVLALALATALLDRDLPPSLEALRERITRPLVAMGRNSLLIYFGSHLVLHVLQSYGGATSYAEQISDAFGFTGYPRVGFIATQVALWGVIAYVLHRRRIYLTP